MADSDRERIRAVAMALGDLAARVVFTGGSVTSLLVTDPAAPPTRLSNDVDAIVNTATLGEFYELEHELRRLKFVQRGGEPICRWFQADLIVDVMPDDERILGFSNRWYAASYREAIAHVLDGVEVRIIGPVWFLATKLEAFAGRGRGDYQASRDIEDIISIVDGRPTITSEVLASRSDVRTYLQARFAELLATGAFVVAVVGHLGGDDDRAEIVLERLRAISVTASK